jgi:hypothetical protein
MKNTPEEDQYVSDLEAIVSKFNEDLASWRQRSGMQVDFQWSYKRDNFGEENLKNLRLFSVSRTIYRRPPPEPTHMAATLGEMEAALEKTIYF